MPGALGLGHQLGDAPVVIDDVVAGDAAFGDREPVHGARGVAHACVVEQQDRGLARTPARLAIGGGVDG